MEYWLCKIYMTKVARTLCHIASTGLASGISVNDALSWIHETTQLWAATFHSFWKAYSAICDGHTTLHKIETIMIIYIENIKIYTYKSLNHHSNNILLQLYLYK